MYAFSGDSPSFGGITFPALYTYIPIGNYPAAGVIENPFGDLNCIMRRRVFETVGGFSSGYPKDVNQEDRELLTRIALAGYKLDVIPEFLFYYRHHDSSRLRTTENFSNEMRIMSVYRERLESVGLSDLPPLILGLNYRIASTPVPIISEIDRMDYLVNQARWYDLLKALNRKIQKALRKPFRRRALKEERSSSQITFDPPR